ncbi:hypothetical protein CEUSTIGMA_g13108.t1 [Chlamydomonas eustigma]|uniref:Cilium assembly protein DZIP1 N-terminal domain-containing protein n=1 Tax=Chlamydomonas eustigma TaxID=1157962 RepID=A0A250XRX8_9CHLO|nr:hypothetical protein CEUSTIGMA_g13108.t1 [Chlamydomonas eustigma]|eukprot:GAX85692.1 hypothetical protein CEUSTIGMA_g13108.t1 [Chlamydomonas eustigma]
MSNRSGLVRGISEKSSSLTRELDSLADRAFELQQIAQALKEKDDVHMVDKGVQADSAGGVPAFKWERLKRLQPFQYLPFNKKLDWRKVRTMNVDKMIREGDSRSLMDMFNEVSQADMEGESSYNLTESNLVKLVRVCQLMMQFVQYKSEQQYNMQQMMEEDQSELQAHVSLLPNMDLDKLTQGLHKLEMDYSGVADADMDAMFQQVRVEERIGARDVLGGIVDQANKELNERIKALGE